MDFLLSLGLVFIGFLLVLIEIFFIPGINVVGISGFIAVIVGIYYAYSTLPAWEAHGVLVVSIAFGLGLVRAFFKSKAWSRFVLQTNASRKDGFQSLKEDYTGLVKKTGLTITHLRPSGRAQIGDDFFDVVSEGNFIEPDREVVVMKVEGNRIVVRELKH